MQKSNTTKKTILSGIQPTGGLTLGNYLGALKNWVELQKTHDCYFCIVNLHSITTKQDPKDLLNSSYLALALYMASGISPEKSAIFAQSQLPEHAELAWILNCYSYMGELSRMTQFKDKSAKQENIGVGLFTYPILMAADILLYQTELVPVGLDQKQHLELTRDLAIRMNNTHGELFKVPEAYIPPIGAKIMSLQDPNSKMSKSDPDPHATLFLMDSDDVITKKLKRAVTDSGSEISYSDEKPGIKNLLNIQSAITGTAPAKLVESYQGKQYGHLKLDTANIVINALKPIREKAEELMKDKGELDRILKKGAEQAKARATQTLTKVKSTLGLMSFIGILFLLLFQGCATVGETPEAKLGNIPSDGPVGKTIKKHAHDFTDCGRHSISIQTGTKQKMLLKFTVDASGRVLKPSIDGMSFPDPELHECVIKMLRKITFPKPKDQTPKLVKYPLEIRPG